MLKKLLSKRSIALNIFIRRENRPMEVFFEPPLTPVSHFDTIGPNLKLAYFLSLFFHRLGFLFRLVVIKWENKKGVRG